MPEQRRIRPIIRHLIGRARAVQIDSYGGTKTIVFDIADDSGQFMPVSGVIEEVGGPFNMEGIGRKIRVSVEAMENLGEI